MKKHWVAWVVALALMLAGLAGVVYSQCAPYGAQSFNGALDNPTFWKIDFPSDPSLTFISGGTSGQALRLTQCASSSSSSLCSTSSSSFGQMGGVTTNTGAHAGYTCGTGTSPNGDCTAVANGVGHIEEAWYRAHVRFPTGYQSTPGTQNTVWESHVDSRTETDAANHSSFAYSTLVGVQGGGSTCPGTPAFCTVAGTNPRLFLQVPGGVTTIPNATPFRLFPFATNSLLINHWYDFVFHIIWSPLTTGPTAQQGYIQWWVDGTKVVDQFTPTLYQRTDGTYSYGNGFGAYNYRSWANFASSVDFDEFIWGPLPSSIGFAP